MYRSNLFDFDFTSIGLDSLSFTFSELLNGYLDNCKLLLEVSLPGAV